MNQCGEKGERKAICQRPRGHDGAHFWAADRRAYPFQVKHPSRAEVFMHAKTHRGEFSVWGEPDEGEA